MSENILEQTKNALDFIRKLHLEISYLFREIESMLLKEMERFVILKPGGYQVTTRTSKGLEPASVDLWMPKDFSIFFVPEESIKESKNIPLAQSKEDLKVLFFQVKILNGNFSEPKIYYGFFSNIKLKKEHYKIEQLLSDFTYSSNRIFQNPPNIIFDSTYWSFKGKFQQVNLFSINDSEQLRKTVIVPALKLYRR